MTTQDKKPSFTKAEFNTFIPAFEQYGWDALQEEFQRNYSADTIAELKEFYDSIYEA